MQSSRVDSYMAANSKEFNESARPAIRALLERLPDDAIFSLEAVKIKNPTTSLILSLFLGVFGVDRFYIGDIGMGVLKLLTAGCLGIMTIIDWFRIMGRTRSKNYENFMKTVSMISPVTERIVKEVDPTPMTDPDAEKAAAATAALKEKANDLTYGAVDKVSDVVNNVKDKATEALSDKKGE